MLDAEQIANKCFKISFNLNFSLLKLLKNFGLHEANFYRIRDGECSVREVTKQKLTKMLNFLEQSQEIHEQALGV